MHPIFGTIIGIVAETLVLLGAWGAYKDDFLTPRQMRLRGVYYGLPFIGHGGMWGDFVVVSTFGGYIVTLYSPEWSLSQVVFMLVSGFAVSIVMHILYARGGFPSAHAHSGKLTTAGWIHVVYMGGALAVFGLFYLYTSHVSVWFLTTVSVFMAIHMVIGNNTILRILKPSWCPRETLQQRIPGYVSVAVVWMFLAWRTYAIIKAE